MKGEVKLKNVITKIENYRTRNINLQLCHQGFQNISKGPLHFLGIFSCLSVPLLNYEVLFLTVL